GEDAPGIGNCVTDYIQVSVHRADGIVRGYVFDDAAGYGAGVYAIGGGAELERAAVEVIGGDVQQLGVGEIASGGINDDGGAEVVAGEFSVPVAVDGEGVDLHVVGLHDEAVLSIRDVIVD